MSWHYAIGGESRGPVEPAEFDRLVAEGVIQADTLVWTEGMPDWKPHLQVASPSAAGTAPTAIATGTACAECGRPVAPDAFVRLGGKPVCAACKPLVLQRLREGVAEGGAEQVRREHLNHEASLQAVGFLYLLGGVLLLVAGVGFIAGGRTAMPGLVVGPFFLVLCAIQFAVGLGLRRLRRWARVPAIILSALGLILGFPIGTLINGYILYLLLSRKGVMVFSEEYERIREATPHIKYRTSIVVWIVLGLFLLLLAVVIVAALAR